jgi:hypothetical protein
VGTRDVQAQGDNDNCHLQARPFTFVGDETECGGVEGSRIVTAAWLGGMGLPDNGEPNTTAATLADSSSKNTGVPTTEVPRGVGLAELDNIAINGDLIEQGNGIADGDDRHDHDDERRRDR